jgi:peptide/nickel transport system permease protein
VAVTPAITSLEQSSLEAGRRGVSTTLRRLLRTRSGQVGVAGVAFFAVMALVGVFFFGTIRTGSAASSVLQGPSGAHPLGTDQVGRDVLAEIVAGAAVPFVVGIVASLISALVGTTIGIASGFHRGWLGYVLTRVTEIMIVLPALPLIIVLAAIVGQSLQNIILVIGLTSWAVTAELLRAEVLSLRERAYVVRARAVGVSPLKIMRVHVLPQVMPLVIANTVLITAVAILTEATLSFLGLGDPTRMSWGQMLEDAFQAGAAGRGDWAFIVVPGLCIMLLVLSFTLIGHALGDILNPRVQDE